MNTSTNTRGIQNGIRQAFIYRGLQVMPTLDGGWMCIISGKPQVESTEDDACDDEIKSRTAEIITPLQDDLDHLKSLIADIVIAGGETIRTPFGRIEYVRAGERVSWDDRALLGFAVAHPEILQMRSTKETAPAVRIKFEVKP